MFCLSAAASPLHPQPAFPSPLQLHGVGEAFWILLDRKWSSEQNRSWNGTHHGTEPSHLRSNAQMGNWEAFFSFYMLINANNKCKGNEQGWNHEANSFFVLLWVGADQVCATEGCTRQFQAYCSNFNFQTNLNYQENKYELLVNPFLKNLKAPVETC